MPYIIKAKGYVRTVSKSCSHRQSSGGNGSCMMAPTDLNFFDLSQSATSVPHVQQPENLKGKFIGPSLETHTKESCSDAWDAENGLRLLLTEKSPDGKAEARHSQPHPPGSHQTLL